MIFLDHIDKGIGLIKLTQLLSLSIMCQSCLLGDQKLVWIKVTRLYITYGSEGTVAEYDGVGSCGNGQHEGVAAADGRCQHHVDGVQAHAYRQLKNKIFYHIMLIWKRYFWLAEKFFKWKFD